MFSNQTPSEKVKQKIYLVKKKQKNEISIDENTQQQGKKLSEPFLVRMNTMIYDAPTKPSLPLWAVECWTHVMAATQFVEETKWRRQWWELARGRRCVPSAHHGWPTHWVCISELRCEPWIKEHPVNQNTPFKESLGLLCWWRMFVGAAALLLLFCMPTSSMPDLHTNRQQCREAPRDLLMTWLGHLYVTVFRLLAEGQRRRTFATGNLPLRISPATLRYQSAAKYGTMLS